jgi:hypothetical protein
MQKPSHHRVSVVCVDFLNKKVLFQMPLLLGLYVKQRKT